MKFLSFHLRPAVFEKLFIDMRWKFLYSIYEYMLIHANFVEKIGWQKALFSDLQTFGEHAVKREGRNFEYLACLGLTLDRGMFNMEKARGMPNGKRTEAP